MLEGIETTAIVVARCAIFEHFYLNEASMVKDQIHARLVALYTAILLYLSKAYHFYSRPTLSQPPYPINS
jgi:hypothetical protein